MGFDFFDIYNFPFITWKICIMSVIQNTVFIMNEYLIRHVACDDDMKYVISTSILLFTALHVSVVIFIWCVKI